MGVSVFEEEIEDTLNKSKHIPHRYSEVLTKRFNIWRNGGEEFINDEDWNRCHNIKESKPVKGQPLLIGIDLSSASDISAMWCVQPTGKAGEVRVWGNSYLPRRALENDKKTVPSIASGQKWDG